MWSNAHISNSVNKIKKWLVRRPKSIIGVDLGTHSLKIVEMDISHEIPVLKGIGIADTYNSDDMASDSSTLAETLRRLLDTSGVTGKDAVVAINSSKIFVRELTFPAMTVAELTEAIKWDLENYVPYAPGSYYYDFAVLKSDSELETKVLLVAAPNDAVNSAVEIIKEAGLRPLAVDIEPLALYRTLNAGENAAVIDIGAEMSQIILYQHGVPSITRAIPIGGRRFTEVVMRSLELEFTEAESLKKRQKGLLRRPDITESFTDIHQQLEILSAELVRELRRTLEYYQIQNKNAVIDKIILSGGGSKMDNLASHLSRQLEMSIVNHNVLAVVNTAPSFNKEYLQELAPQLAVAIGLALRGGEI